MFTQEHLKVDVKGLNVQDTLTLLQIIRRLVKSGVLEDIELTAITDVRSKLVRIVQDATSVNYDVAFAQAMQMGPAAAAMAGQQARPKAEAEPLPAKRIA